MRRSLSDSHDNTLYYLFLEALSGRAEYVIRRNDERAFRSRTMLTTYRMDVSVKESQFTLQDGDHAYETMRILGAITSSMFDRCGDTQEKIEYAERQMLMWAEKMKKLGVR